MIQLTNFEKHINAEIVERGLEYYKSGYIISLKQSKDNWRAKVSGSEIYEVRVKLSGQTITESICSCPYNLGSYCKHEVAIMYALRDGLNKGLSNQSIKNPPLEETLNRLDKSTLIQIILEQADENPSFHTSLVASFATENSDLTIQDYKKLIREELQSGADKHGFIGYWEAGKAMQGVYNLLDQAQFLIKKKKSEQSLPIAQAALETLVPALQKADDSNGEIGGGIAIAIEIFSDAAPLLAPKESGHFFDYLLQESQHKRYQGWDFHWELLEVAATLVVSDSMQQSLFKTIDILVSRNKKEYVYNYDTERAAKIKLSVFEQRNDQQSYQDFIKENINLHDIRKIAIEQTLKQNNLEQAKKLASEGVSIAKTRWPGLVDDYRKYLLDIAQKQKDNQTAVHLAEDLFLSTADFAFYELLNRITPKDNWKDQVRILIQRIKKGQGHHAGIWTAAEICAKENLIPELWEIVGNEKQIYLAEKYEYLLKTDYTDQLVLIYKTRVYELLKFPMGRQTYHQACAYLTRMKNLGKVAEVNNIIEELSIEYKNRRALIDELSKV